MKQKFTRNVKKKEELFKKEYDEIMKSEKSKEEKLRYRYNKFFFNGPKDTGVLDDVLEIQFKGEFENYDQCVKMEYFNMYKEYNNIHISAGLISDFLSEFEVKWTTWDEYPTKDLLMIFYCIVISLSQNDLDKKYKFNTDIICKEYYIKY